MLKYCECLYVSSLELKAQLSFSDNNVYVACCCRLEIEKNHWIKYTSQ